MQPASIYGSPSEAAPTGAAGAMMPISGSSGDLSQNPYGDGSTAGATGGGLFGEGVSQSTRVNLGPMSFGGINAPAWPFADPLTGGGALSVKSIAMQVVSAVIVAVIVAKLIKKKAG